MSLPRIMAQAIVDVGNFPVDVELTAFLVTVTGEFYGGDTLPKRTYQIGAITEDVAARAGLDLYVGEMDRPN